MKKKSTGARLPSRTCPPKLNALSIQRRRMLLHERKARKSGFTRVAGIDEAGRGPLAGPVVACCLVLKDVRFTHRIDDSKKLTPKARFLVYKELLKKAHYGIGVIDEKRIDEINILNATRKAMEAAVRNLAVKPDFLLVDGRIKLKVPCKRSCIIKGDSKSLSIAGASIIAKVTRDRMMAAYDKKFPRYGFGRHKGYATKEHLRNLKKYGPSLIHRQTFAPVTRSKNPLTNLAGS